KKCFCCVCLCLLPVSQHEVVVGSESVILQCKTTPDLPEDTTVEWTRFDREIMIVHGYSNGSDHLKKQDDHYCGRTKMNKDLLRTGDLSLTLKYPTERDSGEYICIIYRDKDILRQKVVLQVRGQTHDATSIRIAVFCSVISPVLSSGISFPISSVSHAAIYFSTISSSGPRVSSSSGST
uniref:Ig-like domain-containing protein n=1 Tax=Pundamilia nyererei TaxID=303518 RepID=A0A3B4FEH8_9CICH